MRTTAYDELPTATTGPPVSQVELALFVTGRSQVADVTVTGPDAAVAALQRFRPTS